MKELKIKLLFRLINPIIAKVNDAVLREVIQILFSLLVQIFVKQAEAPHSVQTLKAILAKELKYQAEKLGTENAANSAETLSNAGTNATPPPPNF